MQLNENKISELLKNVSINALNEMQKEAYPGFIRHRDSLLLSPTGSGKTIAFLLAVLELMQEETNLVQCLILVPSRELAIQIEQVWKKLATGFKVSCCYGGHDMQTEIQNLVEAPSLLIGTPGRIADHIRRETFLVDGIRTLVLDEFDKSLALGFEEEMSFVIGAIPKITKRIMVSATAAIQVPEFAGVQNLFVMDHLVNEEDNEQLSVQLVISETKDKAERLAQLLCYIGSEQTIIFCNHRDAVERTSILLKEKGIQNAAFHGGMEQMQREQTLIQFRNGSVNFLVATDLAARGLDIPEIKHIIHYHLPSTFAEFTHRNGRTARMNAIGTAYLLMHREEPMPNYIRQNLEPLEIPVNQKPPKPALYTTIYINGGKKDKLNKVDIVGFLAQKGKLDKEDIGLIVVKDFNSFVAVKKSKVNAMLDKVADEKIKGTKYKIVIAK
ncbi:MAG: DEAD/DEAH box helicase [Bacteroidota bacterium]|jgi:superfamily II DNA/RNA helicase